MNRRAFLKHAGLAASLPCLGRIACAAPATSPQPGTHKILSANVRVDVPADSETGDGWAHRRELCATVIKSQKADLIGLQEAQTAHVSYLKSQLPEYDSFALTDAGKRVHPNNTILFLRARYELISRGGFWLSETPQVPGSKSWDSANPRLVNWVQLKDRASGREFRFWNTHLDHKGSEARTKGAAMIVKAAAELPKNFPQLLSGDMNCHAGSAPIRSYEADGWADTYAAVNGPADPGFTAHAFKGANFPPNGPDGKPKRRIDWIFVRGPVKTKHAAIMRDGRDGHYPSDHYFVSATVAF